MFRKLLEDHNVATTALLANFWKHEAKSKEKWAEICQQQGQREKDLFKDDFMQHFIDPEVEAEVKADAEQRLDRKMWLSLANRTRFFRQEIAKAVKEKGIKQIIILGSGFDTLPVRKSKYTSDFGVKFFEVDQPQLLECKEKIYAMHQIDKNAEYIGIDYVKTNLIEELKKRHVDFTQSTLILWEGNTFYLDKKDVTRILSELSAHFSSLIITFDYLHTAMQAKPQALDSDASGSSLEKTLIEFAQKKSPFVTFFAPEEIVELCENQGISCVSHKTAAELAKEYNVDEDPYYTSKIYSMITCERMGKR